LPASPNNGPAIKFVAQIGLWVKKVNIHFKIVWLVVKVCYVI
jgi:hypothetical protein